MCIKQMLRLGIIFSGLFSVAPVFSGVSTGDIVQCGQTICTSDFNISVNGNNLGGGQLQYDSQSGDISLSTENISGGGEVTSAGGIMWIMGNGNTVSVDSLSGNADPILGFGLSASTGSSASTIAMSFNLPIALSGPIDTFSQVSYSLTSLSSAGAQIKGVGGNKVVQSWDIDSDIGGLPDLNKEVDVGDTYFHSGGPATSSSPTYTGIGLITGDLAYDLMSVLVNFNLTKDSRVALTGFVQQEEVGAPVPLPATTWFMLTGIVGFLATAKRKKALSL